MVKYGKQFRRDMIPEWQNHYVSYKILKKIIKKLLKKRKIFSDGAFLSENSKETEINITDSEGHKMIISSRLSENLEIEDQYENRLASTEFLSEFFDQLDKEIKKIYLFYQNLERELYIQINTHLHKRIKYKNFILKDILKEVEQLSKISLLAASFSKYINDNMTAIKKILKKYDKKFKRSSEDSTIKFLKNKLEDQHSDFNYIMQFKIIDEVNVLIEDLIKELSDRYNELIRNKKNKEDKNNLRSSIKGGEVDIKKGNSPLKDPLLNTHNSDLNSDLEEIKEDFLSDQKEMKLKIEQKFEVIKKYLSKIDELTTFRTKIKNMNFYITDGITIHNNYIKILHSEANKTIFIPNEDDELIKIFLSSRNKNYLTKETYQSLSIQNKINIIQCFLHTYLFMSIYSASITTNFLYLKEMGSKEIYSGLFLGLIHIGGMFSTLIMSKWIIRCYKWPMIVSVLFFLIGSILYVFAHPNSASSLPSLFMIGFSRFLIGLGSIRTVNRGYLIQFLPKHLIKRYSDYYLVASLIGMASGPILSIMGIYFNKYTFFDFILFNVYTYPGWFSFLQSLIMLLIIVFFYTEPLSNIFNIYEKEKDTNIIISKEQKNMITDIQEKLNVINIENQFSDTNLVSSNIKLITNKQQSGFSYVSKCFLILLSILFITRVANESVLMIFPYYVYGQETEISKNKLMLINLLMMFTYISGKF